MSLIKGKDTKCEKALAVLLIRAGLRFSTQRSELPGKPDFCLMDAPVAVFVDGAYWHGRHFDAWKRTLNQFWRTKIAENVRRDVRNRRKLRRLGWSVLRMWEEDVFKKPEKCMARILRALNGKRHCTSIRSTS